LVITTTLFITFRLIAHFRTNPCGHPYRTTRSSTVLEYARAGAEAQGGACVEHASLAYAALATRKIDAPVMRVSDRNVDHAYVVIGDPRDPRWGEKNTVVVDPWVRYPTSFTLSESGSLNHTPFMPAVVEREPGSAPPCVRLVVASEFS